MKLFYKLFLFIVIVNTISCNTEPQVCPDYKVPYLRISLTQNAETDTINFMGIYLHNADEFLVDNPELNDTLMFDFGIPGLLGLPLNNTTDTFSIIFNFKHMQKSDTTFIFEDFDTLHIKYSSTPKLDDLECDFYLEYDILDTLCTRNYIDSVAYPSLKINQDEETNVEIYF